MERHHATRIGAPAALAKLWFTTLLRDGFVLAAAGDNSGFADVGTEVLRGLLTGTDLNRSLSRAVEHIMAGVASLGTHPDVVDGVRTLRQAGYRLITLSNGSTAVAEKLVEPTGIRDTAGAGMQTAWINRDGVPYPLCFSPPDHTVTSLTDLPSTLACRGV